MNEIFANDISNKQLIPNIYTKNSQLNIKKKKKNNNKKIGRGPEYTLLLPNKSYRYMGHRHMKRCSTSLTIREMQIKTIMRYNLTPVRMIIIKKTTNNKCWQGWEEKGTLMHCWWHYKLEQPLGGFLKKFKIEVTYDPAISFLGIYLKKTKTLIWKDICTSMFIAALFTIAKIGNNLNVHW